MTGSQTLEIVFLPFNNLSSLLKKEIIVKEELISRVCDLKSKKVNTFYSVHFTLYTVNKNSYVCTQYQITAIWLHSLCIFSIPCKKNMKIIFCKAKSTWCVVGIGN